MAESILTITSRLTGVAELIMEIELNQLSEEELAVLKDRLPAWSLTLSAMTRSITALEEPSRHE